MESVGEEITLPEYEERSQAAQREEEEYEARDAAEASTVIDKEATPQRKNRGRQRTKDRTRAKTDEAEIQKLTKALPKLDVTEERPKKPSKERTVEGNPSPPQRQRSHRDRKQRSRRTREHRRDKDEDGDEDVSTTLRELKREMEEEKIHRKSPRHGRRGRKDQGSSVASSTDRRRKPTSPLPRRRSRGSGRVVSSPARKGRRKGRYSIRDPSISEGDSDHFTRLYEDDSSEVDTVRTETEDQSRVQVTSSSCCSFTEDSYTEFSRSTDGTETGTGTGTDGGTTIESYSSYDDSTVSRSVYESDGSFTGTNYSHDSYSSVDDSEYDEFSTGSSETGSTFENSRYTSRRGGHRSRASSSLEGRDGDDSRPGRKLRSITRGGTKTEKESAPTRRGSRSKRWSSVERTTRKKYSSRMTSPGKRRGRKNQRSDSSVDEVFF